LELPVRRTQKAVPVSFCWRFLPAAGHTGLVDQSDVPVAETAQATVVEPEAAPDQAALALPEADREFVWSLEHHGNVLNKFGLRRLGERAAEQDCRNVAGDSRRRISRPGFL